MAIKDKYIATLVGTAIGDTLGMPVESWKPGQIKKYIGKVTEPMAPIIVKDSQGNIVNEDEFGKLRSFGRNLKKGDITDDTILTLAVASSISECGFVDLDDLARKHIAAYDDCLSSGKSTFGRTTREAIENMKNGAKPWKSGIIGGPGNAPAMKMAPLGLYMHATGGYEAGLRQAESIGRLTHLDPRSVASGVVQAHAIYSLLEGISRDDFVESAYKVCKGHEKPLTSEFRAQGAGTLASKLEWIAKNRDARVEEAYNHIKCSDLVTESYPFALFMFQKYWDNPIEGLIETVNYGGDADTTGAMFGALAGARHGMVFPEEWINETQGIERLIKAAKSIYEIGKKD
jgi:ADP-ribosyl-[dinitrogen reductase] hydrolase